MEILSTTFLMALLTIIVIDLVLAGDNALVIGLAARNVPTDMQKRVILWGTAGAIAIRIAFTRATTTMNIAASKMASGARSKPSSWLMR